MFRVRKPFAHDVLNGRIPGFFFENMAEALEAVSGQGSQRMEVDRVDVIFFDRFYGINQLVFPQLRFGGAVFQPAQFDDDFPCQQVQLQDVMRPLRDHHLLHSFQQMQQQMAAVVKKQPVLQRDRRVVVSKPDI
uniref:hypothetical protein n=1 Tax=Paenibacillus cymbidii TaxID=1639034 RepID=UPI0010814E31